jgi:hypothetical protein
MKCSFVHYKGAWYSSSSNQPNYNWYDEVMILVENAEIAFRWYKIKRNLTAIRLEVFDESMQCINTISDVIDYVAENNNTPSPLQFCKKLVEMGYEDETPHEKDE